MPDGNWILTASLSGSSPKLINVETGSVKQTFSEHMDRITALTLTKNGCRAISASDDNL